MSYDPHIPADHTLKVSPPVVVLSLPVRSVWTFHIHRHRFPRSFRREHADLQMCDAQTGK